MRETLSRRSVRGEDLHARAGSEVFSRVMAGKLSEVEISRAAGRAQGQGRDAGGDRRCGRGPAGGRHAVRTGELDVWPTPAARAATAPAPSTSPPRWRCLLRRLGMPWSSTATVRCRRRCGSADVLERCGVRDRRQPDGVAALPAKSSGSVFCSRPSTTRACGTPCRCAGLWVCARSSICSGRWPTRPARAVRSGRLRSGAVRARGPDPGPAGLRSGPGGARLGPGRDRAARSDHAAPLRRDGEVRNAGYRPRGAGPGYPSPRGAARRRAAENARLAAGAARRQGPGATTRPVALNAGALLWVAGRPPICSAGYQRALQTMRSGKAAAPTRLQRLGGAVAMVLEAHRRRTSARRWPQRKRASTARPASAQRPAARSTRSLRGARCRRPRPGFMLECKQRVPFQRADPPGLRSRRHRATATLRRQTASRC